MTARREKKIIRLLGVGFDHDDGHIRLTQGDTFDVIMGSAESHEYISGLIRKIEDALDQRGVTLNDLSTAEFTELIETIV